VLASRGQSPRHLGPLPELYRLRHSCQRSLAWDQGAWAVRSCAATCSAETYDMLRQLLLYIGR